MSEDTSVKSRKAKKAERDAARRQGGKKRKAAEHEVPNLPGDEQEEDNDDAAVIATTDKSVTQPKTKKRKHNSETEGADGAADAGDSTSTQPKRKRTKPASTTATADGDESTATAPAKSRFIVFVGNLPYTTTDSSLRAHFAKLEPFTLRHRTEPKSNKSKGFAFLEFENYDRMKTCLKLYHHSMFDPDEHTSSNARKQPSGRGGRRINVELTAGGGGKTEGRKEKIRVKNQRLEEQRKRRAEQEQKTAERQAAKKEAGGAKTSGGDVDHSASSGIHPSRLAQMAR